jgi:hypothetical protein
MVERLPSGSAKRSIRRTRLPYAKAFCLSRGKRTFSGLPRAWQKPDYRPDKLTSPKINPPLFLAAVAKARPLAEIRA